MGLLFILEMKASIQHFLTGPIEQLCIGEYGD